MLELFDYIRKINIKIKFLSTDIFAGEYASAFKGRGLEFEEVREYIIGDDIKTIDWNTTARTGKLHTKVFREERELTVIIMLDISSSMTFGSKWQLKSEIATEISGLLSYTAIRNNDKVGLILFSDKVEKFIAPKKGRNHIWHIIKSIVATKSLSKKTNISKILTFLANTIKRKSIVFIISDFIDDLNFFSNIKALKRKFDIVPIIVTDPLELNFSGKSNIFSFKDNEIENLFLNKINFKSNHYNIVKENFKKNSIIPIEIFTNKPYIYEIARYFRKRVK